MRREIIGLGLVLLALEASAVVAFKDAAKDIVRLLGYRALYVNRVSSLAMEKYGNRHPYTRLLRKIERDKLEVTRPLE